MVRRPVTRALAAGAAVLALALAGCGGDAASRAEPSETSTATPASTPTPSPSATSSQTQSPSPAAKTLGGLIAKSLERGTAHVEVKLVGTDGTASGDLDFRAGEPAMDVTLTDPGTLEARLIVVDGTAYAKSADSEMFQAADPSAAGVDAYGFDPTSVLDQVQGFASGKNLGDGHFRFTQDDRTVDFFFGPDQLLHRMTMTGGLPADGTLKVRWTDWGKPVTIKAPPKDRVTTVPVQ